MSEDIYAQFLMGSIEESANSTLTEGDAIPTGASVNRFQGATVGIEIHRITAHLSLPEDSPSSGNSEYVKFCLSTRTGLSSFPAFSERHVVYMNGTQIRSGVATYLPLIWTRDMYHDHDCHFDKAMLLAHPYLYPYILSNNSSAKATCHYRITYNMVLLEGDLTLEALEAFRYGD